MLKIPGFCGLCVETYGVSLQEVPFCQETKLWLFRLESIFWGNVSVREELVVPVDEWPGFLRRS